MKNNICTHQNCDLKLHKNLDKCVLHCHKNNYHTDRSSGLLSEFYKELKGYILNQIFEDNDLLDKESDEQLTRDYPKEQYKDLYETTVSRMKKLSGDLTGQHFTQKSIVHLMCEVSKFEAEGYNKLAIYDPTCGTASMLMESAYYFYNKNKIENIEVYGQELHGQTWLLAKIFLEISSLDGKTQGIKNTVAYGNTLTNPAFANGINGNTSFDFIIANPPFGVDWKHNYNEIIENMNSKKSNFFVVKDEKGKVVTPKKSDGQFLFMQHIIHLMKSEKKRDKHAHAAIISSSTLISTGNATVRSALPFCFSASFR
jgi:type I restriction enzyme M protein